MILTSDQADTILRSVSIDESLTSSFAQLLLDIGEAFPELKADNENVLHHAKQQLPLALAREERNRVHFAMIQEGIERRKKQ